MRFSVSLGKRWKVFRALSHHYRVSLCTSSVTDTDIDGASSGPAVQNEPCLQDQKVLRAAILGVPNAGKTTLVNQLLGQKLFAVSPKRHTTIRSAMGVFTEESRQVILIDTPGVIPYQVGRKLKAPKSFLTGPQRSLMEAELVVVMVDASDKRTRHQLDQQLMQTLARHSHIPAVLLLNKIDIVRHKRVLLEITESITEAAGKRVWEDAGKGDGRRRKSPNADVNKSFQLNSLSSEIAGQSTGKEPPTVQYFQEVFMVSALTGDGVPDLRAEQWSLTRNDIECVPIISIAVTRSVLIPEDYLSTCTRPGLWEYTVTEHSDQSQMTLMEDIVREKLFLHLHREIPYVLTQSNVIWEKEGDTQIIYQNITCRSTNQASIVIGPAGATIQAITAEARADIETLLGCPVDLTLNIKTRK